MQTKIKDAAHKRRLLFWFVMMILICNDDFYKTQKPSVEYFFQAIFRNF